jgi:hypothetical protein
MVSAGNYDEATLFELEKKILKKYETFKNVEPKPIKIVAIDDCDGRAEDSEMLVSSKFLQKNPTLKEVNDLLKHELLHYACKGEGHGPGFCAKARKLKIADESTYRQLFSEGNKGWLDGRLTYEVNEQGEAVLIDKRKPSFDRFFGDFVLGRGVPIAWAYRRLREAHGLSIREVALRSGISEDEIVKIETENSGYKIRDETTLRKVFKAIVHKPKSPSA